VAKQPPAELLKPNELVIFIRARGWFQPHQKTTEAVLNVIKRGGQNELPTILVYA